VGIHGVGLGQALSRSEGHNKGYSYFYIGNTSIRVFQLQITCSQAFIKYFKRSLVWIQGRKLGLDSRILMVWDVLC